MIEPIIIAVLSGPVWILAPSPQFSSSPSPSPPPTPDKAAEDKSESRFARVLQ